MRGVVWFALGMLMLLWTSCGRGIAQSPQASPPKHAFQFGQDLITEYGRVIAILQRGIDENWTREQYLKVFDTPDYRQKSGEDRALRAAIRQAIEWRMPEAVIWDEKPPISVQAAQLMDEYSRQRQLLIRAQDAPARGKRDPAKLAP